MAALREEGRYPAVQKLTKSEYDNFVTSCSKDVQKPAPKLVELLRSGKKG